MQTLSPEIISLIHHIKLNEAGWQEKSIQSLIISTIGNNSNHNMPIPPDTIFRILVKEINSNLNKSLFINAIEKLKNSAKIKITPNGYILPEEIYTDFQQQLSKQIEIEEKTYNFFLHICAINAPNLSGKSIWNDLKENLLLPAIKTIGAKTTNWISGKENIKIEDTLYYQHFLTKYESEQVNIRKIIFDFFDFKNDVIKKYILSLRDAYFFIQASSLDYKDVEAIYKNAKAQPKLKIFVDTNFLLTLIDLHDNPSNEATDYLLTLLDEIKNKVNIRFYVLPLTIEELQNLLKKFKEYLSKIKPNLNYAFAAEKNEEFSGILKKYYERCVRQKSMINLDDYFDPYLTNFVVAIRKKGVEIHNDKHLANYSTNQKVIDDLLRQTDFRLDRLKETQQLKAYSEEELQFEKKRIYDKLNHDIQLWHIIKDRRPYTDGPKDITDWIVTLDYGFLAFDRFKQKVDKTVKIGICLHPNDLISMLQFWVPRTQTFENAILGNLRLPFLFKEIDTDGEKVSLKILEALSYYEGNEDFSSEEITEMLTNNAIRQKIKPSNTVENNAELIKEEIFKKYEEASRKLKESETENIALNETVNHEKTQVDQLVNLVNELVAENQKKVEKILREIQKSKVTELNKKKNDIEKQIEKHTEIQKHFTELKDRANKEFEVEQNKFSFKIKSLFQREESINQLKENIHKKYYDKQKTEDIEKQLLMLKSDLEQLSIPYIEEKIIVFCENQNAKIFNKLGFKDIHFQPESNSNAVYIKISANSSYFGIRDRDFLSDDEVLKIRKKHPNYFILNFYCYENYLYHPSNIKELNLEGLSIEVYRQELISQKKQKKEKLLLNLKLSRKSYQEFKISEDKFQDFNEDSIVDNLGSDEIDIFLKSFSLKDHFDKKILEKYNLKEETLASTNWFKKQMSNLFLSAIS
jgi:hypothetical protein